MNEYTLEKAKAFAESFPVTKYVVSFVSDNCNVMERRYFYFVSAAEAGKFIEGFDENMGFPNTVEVFKLEQADKSKILSVWNKKMKRIQRRENK